MANIKKLEKFTCMDIPSSGGNDSLISQKLAANDTEYFSDEYLKFLMSPEEMGCAFETPGQANFMGPINLELLKKVSDFITKLPMDVKSVMIQKLDDYMVYYTIDDRELPMQILFPQYQVF